MVSKASGKKHFLPKLKKKFSLKLDWVSIRIRNFAAPNEPLSIKKTIFILTQKSPPTETLWCKNHQNPSYRKSHTLAPLKSHYHWRIRMMAYPSVRVGGETIVCDGYKASCIPSVKWGVRDEGETMECDGYQKSSIPSERWGVISTILITAV